VWVPLSDWFTRSKFTAPADTVLAGANGKPLDAHNEAALVQFRVKLNSVTADVSIEPDSDHAANAARQISGIVAPAPPSLLSWIILYNGAPYRG